MTHENEILVFLRTWETEAQNAIRTMESIPPEMYDFRPDPKGRSIGEMAWHLCEVDGCLSYGVVERRFDPADELPELKRPKETHLLAPGFRRVHELALERLRNLKPHELDEKVTYFDGTPMTIRDVLWYGMLHHLIHHRAQLVLLIRQSGGTPPGIYGPNREEMQAMKDKVGAKA